MDAFVTRLAARLPAPARTHLSPARVALLAQFLRFGVVGGVTFLVDAATVYALRGSLGLYRAGLVSYVVAATFSWALNRAWTFADADRGAAHRQWAMFLATNLVGFALNRGTFFALIAYSAFCAANPILPVGAGAIAGMFTNFGLSRRLVFR